MRRMLMSDPMASIRAGRARFAVVVIVLLAIAILIGVSFHSVSKNASAGIMKVVRGYILDQYANPIGGANVTIKAVRGGTTMDTLWYDLSEPDGLYSVIFSIMDDDLQVGDTIEVTASYSGHSATNSAIADSLGLQYIDVTISDVVIPEFGSLSVAMVCSSFVAVFILIGRRRAGL
jgi:hypothetical protein